MTVSCNVTVIHIKVQSGLIADIYKLGIYLPPFNCYVHEIVNKANLASV